MKLRDEETGQLYECEYACDGINQDRYIKTARIVVEDRSKWHPHHDLIVAWARGAEIEWWDKDDKAWHTANPCWEVNTKYRIKPKNSEKIAELLARHKALADEMCEVDEMLFKLGVE